MKEFLNKLKSFYGLAGSISVVLPGAAFFLKKYIPPLFDEISIMVSALAIVFLWLGYKHTIKNEEKNLIEKSIFYIVLGFLVLLSYLILLDQTSITIGNSKETSCYQIGYGMAQWSLTQKAQDLIKISPCGNSKIELLRCTGATMENVYMLWKKWTINLFGILNILLFSIAFSLWAYGWGKLMKTA